jgi:hypothetical protein
MNTDKARRVLGWALENEYEQTGPYKARSRVTGRDYWAIWWDGQITCIRESVPDEFGNRPAPVGAKVYGHGAPVDEC